MIRYSLIIALLSLSGCAIVPENIQVANEAALVSYEQVISTGPQAVDKPARWGGIIAGVTNKQGISEVEVVHFPLNSYGKPFVANESVGRFKVNIEGFLDPIVFESGRTITFTGVVNEPTEGMVGEQTYLFPTLAANSYHLWRKEAVYDVTGTHFDFHTGWYSPYWYHPFRHRFGRHGFTHSRVRYVERAPKSNPNSGSTQQRRQTSTDPAVVDSPTRVYKRH